MSRIIIGPTFRLRRVARSWTGGPFPWSVQSLTSHVHGVIHLRKTRNASLECQAEYGATWVAIQCQQHLVWRSHNYRRMSKHHVHLPRYLCDCSRLWSQHCWFVPFVNPALTVHLDVTLEGLIGAIKQFIKDPKWFFTSTRIMVSSRFLPRYFGLTSYSTVNIYSPKAFCKGKILR